MDKTVKNSVKEVFDSLAVEKSWESLYEGKCDRLTYNFVSRQRAVEELLKPYVKGRVLDLGCGSGDLFPFFAGHCDHYIGVDLSDEMTRRAGVKYKDLIAANNAEFIAGDSENLTFPDESFDVVASVALIEYFSNPDRVLDEIKRVTKTGGIALVTVPHKSCINFKVRNIAAPFRNLLFPLYAKMKKASLGRMRNVKHTHYNPEELDTMMAERSFKRIGSKFTNFYFVFHPFDHLFSGVYIKLSELADRLKKQSLFRKWAANYIAVYKKVTK